MDWGIRAGEVVLTRRNPVELLHEFIERHELRLATVFNKCDVGMCGHVTLEELLHGLLTMGVEFAEGQKETFAKFIMPEAAEDPETKLNYVDFAERMYSQEALVAAN